MAIAALMVSVVTMAAALVWSVVELRRLWR